MKGFTAFMKKELLEAVRSYKLVILLIVFAALGFMNPVSARYLPELVAGFLPEGMHMEIPQPVVLDSWLQFFKNTAQIGLIAIIIMCSSSMANEIGKGVLIPLLAKGMPRNSVLAAKFISISCLWTLSLGCSFLITFLQFRILGKLSRAASVSACNWGMAVWFDDDSLYDSGGRV